MDKSTSQTCSQGSWHFRMRSCVWKQRGSPLEISGTSLLPSEGHPIRAATCTSLQQPSLTRTGVFHSILAPLTSWFIRALTERSLVRASSRCQKHQVEESQREQPRCLAFQRAAWSSKATYLFFFNSYTNSPNLVTN